MRRKRGEMMKKIVISKLSGKKLISLDFLRFVWVVRLGKGRETSSTLKMAANNNNIAKIPAAQPEIHI